ncbi:MAG: hypothetical protein R3D71_06500 [Rickettsiales bacterium]
MKKTEQDIKEKLESIISSVASSKEGGKVGGHVVVRQQVDDNNKTTNITITYNRPLDSHINKGMDLQDHQKKSIIESHILLDELRKAEVIKNSGEVGNSLREIRQPDLDEKGHYPDNSINVADNVRMKINERGNVVLSIKHSQPAGSKDKDLDKSLDSVLKKYTKVSANIAAINNLESSRGKAINF